MAFSGDVEGMPQPGTGHQAEACMKDRGGLAGPETTSDHHEASKMSTSKKGEEEKLLPPAANEEGDGQESAREKLKRHRREMAGKVWVPEMWGQEKLLKDWMDCSAFDRPLVPAGLLTARRALVAESCARRPAQAPPASSSPLRVQNGCS